MYVTLLDPDPKVSVQQVYMPHKYNMIDSTIACVDYAADLGHDPEYLPEIHGNLGLWTDSLPALCLYAVMLAETVPQRSNVKSKIQHLDYMMKRFAIDTEEKEPWPAWRNDPAYINAARGYVIQGKEEWYKQFDWYESAKPCPVPVPFPRTW